MEIYKVFLNFIESSVHEEFNEEDFIKKFRDKINKYLKDRLK